MASSIIEAIREYISTCPLLGDSKLNIDYLSEQSKEYSIDIMPGSGTIKKYTSGSSIEKYLFVIRTSNTYSSDVLQQLENSEFFEHLKAWLDEQSAKNNLPQLPKGKSSQQIEAVNGAGYLMNVNATTGIYQIQCVLTYYKEKE